MKGDMYKKYIYKKLKIFNNLEYTYKYINIFKMR